MNAMFCSAVAFTVVIGCSTANATVIGFDSLNGVDGDPYTGHIENGFTITAFDSTTWHAGLLFGNPTPSIFATAGFGTIVITGSGQFTFASVDLAVTSPGGCPTCANFLIIGYQTAVPVLTVSGTASAAFQTVFSTDPSQLLDYLVIEKFNGPSGFHIDNIVLNAGQSIPEPTTFVIVGAGLTGLAILSRRCLAAEIKNHWSRMWPDDAATP